MNIYKYQFLWVKKILVINFMMPYIYAYLLKSVKIPKNNLFTLLLQKKKCLVTIKANNSEDELTVEPLKFVGINLCDFSLVCEAYISCKLKILYSMVNLHSCFVSMTCRNFRNLKTLIIKKHAFKTVNI